MRTISALLSAALVVALVGCGGPVSVKQQIDRADRTAFASLRAFQQVETAAFKAGLAWPTAQQHKTINAKLSEAYLLVIDVANLGIAIQPGAPTPAALATDLARLQALAADIIALAGSAPPNIVAAAAKAQTDTQALVAAGGKP